MTPDISKRLAARQRPAGLAVGRQRWTELLFLHWEIEPSVIQRSLPPGLTVDTHEGKAYLGIVPFYMDRIRPSFLPPVPWISWFLELNVRTYVLDENGNPGVWFYSLDCNQPLAVAIARRLFHLPYQHARMEASKHEGHVHYTCTRQGLDESWSYEWNRSEVLQEAEPGSLEFFLVERYALFSQGRGGRLFQGRVSHTPYRFMNAQVTTFSSGPAGALGFALAGAPCSALASPGVDVEVFGLTSV
ncbi:MAG: DUF2071 domain-containing protein [Verrucomicrobiaceae bacterium]|nr:DUF2071 domain-containing protein [Verrucomicrobiaceae bacterium]